MTKKCPYEIETTFYAMKGKRGKYHDVVKKTHRKTKHGKQTYSERVSSHRTFKGAQKKLGSLCK